MSLQSAVVHCVKISIFAIIVSIFGVFLSIFSWENEKITLGNWQNQLYISSNFFEKVAFIPRANALTQTNTGVASATPETPSTPIDEASKALQTAVGFVNAATTILKVILSPIAMLVGWLMSPDWTSGDLFNLREPMYRLWVTISNIIYFAYAILLLFIAVATIFNSKNYGYRALLPRLFLGIILVPFTWWFVQFIISVSTFLTTSVMSIPTDTLMETIQTDKKNFLNTPLIPKNVSIQQTSFDNTQQIKQECVISGENTSNCLTPAEFIQNAGGIYGPIMLYSYAIFRIQDVHNINTGVDLMANFFSVLSDGVIQMLMFLLFAILTIALMAILFVRAFKLWMYAIFSPLFTFKIVLKDTWKGDDFDINDFIGLAFLPALIGLILSFWLVVVASLYNPLQFSSGEETKKCAIVKTIDENTKPCSRFTILWSDKSHIDTFYQSMWSGQNDVKTVTRLTLGGVSTQYVGSLGSSVAVKQGNAEISVSPHLNVFGDIILRALSLLFIWIAFSMAVKVNKVAESVSRPFLSIGAKIKDAGMVAAQQIPLPYVGNVHGLNRAFEDHKSNVRADINAKYSQSRVARELGVPPSRTRDQQRRYDNFLRSIENIGQVSTAQMTSYQGTFEKILEDMQERWLNERQAREELYQLISQIIQNAPKDDNGNLKNGEIIINNINKLLDPYINANAKLSTNLTNIEEIHKRTKEIFANSSNFQEGTLMRDLLNSQKPQ